MICIMLIPPLPVSALEIISKKTEKHVLVPGTNACFAPASGLVAASEFSGFESKNRKIEVIVVYLDGPLNSIEEGFTEASFASLGMNMLSKGGFTIDSRRAVLYKVLHDDGSTKWGKWVMLAEDGPGTLMVNAIFVSGDSDAASELEQMLKGVCMEPMAGAEKTEETSPGEPAAEHPAPSLDISADIASGDAVSHTASQDNIPARSADTQISFDKNEALSILTKEVASSQESVSDDEREQPVSEPAGAASADKPERRGSARIITEDGVVYIGGQTDTPAESVRETASGDVTSDDSVVQDK